MFSEILTSLHRRLFGRCQGCDKRLGRYPARVLWYRWNVWGRSESGLWHLDCLQKQVVTNPAHGAQPYDRRETMALRARRGG